MRIPLVIGSVGLLLGCAAILGSKEKNFDLRSHPDGAEVFLDGARLGTTPFKVNLSNQKEHTFVFRKEGYKEVSCTLSRGTGGGWVVADVLLGLVPVIVDAATSSWSQTKGDSCLGSMEPMAVVAAPTATVRARMVQDQMPALPPGIRYIGDSRTNMVYPVGCAATQQIAVASRYFYITEDAAIADGFKPSPAC